MQKSKSIMKICNTCGIEKDLNEFCKNKQCNEGRSGQCKSCHVKKIVEHQRTIKGLTTKIYSAQRQSSKDRKHPMPDYTNLELREWIISQHNFEELYNNWKSSNYNRKLSPSVDRDDDYKPYTFNNINLTSWEINEAKGNNDRKNGINNKKSKAVIRYNLHEEYIDEFYSMMQVERELNIKASDISACCRKVQKTAGGFIWKYKN